MIRGFILLAGALLAAVPAGAQPPASAAARGRLLGARTVNLPIVAPVEAP